MVLPKTLNSDVMSQFSLHDKVAAITGGAGGIGREVSLGLAEAGASIALLYNTSSSASHLAQEISEKTNVRVCVYQADMRNVGSIHAAVDKVVADFGRLDIVVVNAGVAAHHSALESTTEEYRDVMRVNLDGAFYTAQAAGKVFQRQGSGNAIFTASVSAQVVDVPQKQAAYNASKAGVVTLAKCLAVEWVDFARVNCISPGFISTDMLVTHPIEYLDTWLAMVPAGRLCEPHELKGAYVFLASNASSYMTGANLVIDGAFTLI